MLLNRAPFVAVRRGNPPPHKVLNHGDLAGTSVLWSGGAVVGVLDWDLASRDNPAGGIASLADWQGWQVASHLADKPTVQRAKVMSQSFPLQSIGFALTRNRPAEEVERTIGRAAERIRRRSVCIDW
ncbi:phosphotransferase [Arthrobacter sp. KK5.5]|uniref:phosphotransferase n=1 Tax=Arthrobacter sp. KK5.5 TaxID=3373084 RepID=UPI003EE4E5DF